MGSGAGRLTTADSLRCAGLYGERVGALNFILSDAASAQRVLSQLKRLARAIYSNPPTHGARIAAEVVSQPQMFDEWKQEMQGMAGRIKARSPPASSPHRPAGLGSCMCGCCSSHRLAGEQPPPQHEHGHLRT